MLSLSNNDFNHKYNKLIQNGVLFFTILLFELLLFVFSTFFFYFIFKFKQKIN